VICQAEIIIEPAEAGVRLDHVLANRFPASSRSLVIRAIENGDVLLNGKSARKGNKVISGSIVFVKQLPENDDLVVTPNPEIPLSILYEDAALLVLNKPAGIPVHPIEYTDTQTLANGLVARFPELGAVGSDRLFPSFVHRLDTDTSGVLVAAKNNAGHEALRKQFGTRQISKKYIALAHGQIAKADHLVHFLAHSAVNGQHRMRALEKPVEHDRRPALRAVTDYTLRHAYAVYSLLDVIIHTGITHQIRCQLAASGHPVAGDVLYGCSEPDFIRRLCLHASELELTHPLTGQRLRFEAPLPPDFTAILEALDP